MIGFVFGYLLFRILLLVRGDSIKIAVYAPLLPFTFGIWFGLPYLTELADAGELQDYIGQAVNLFGAYGWLHHQVFVTAYLTGLNKVALACGFIYLLIIWHYIKLIKSIRNQNAG
ncbi:MAG: hypothetical protein R8K22_07795 [Mariprofundaceae bacterium]